MVQIRPGSSDPSLPPRTIAMTSLAPWPTAGSEWRGDEAMLGNGGNEGVGGRDRAGRRAARRGHEELGEQMGGEKRVSASITATASMAWRLGRSGLSWG